MGIDYEANSGIIATLDQMLKLIDEDNYLEIIEGIKLNIAQWREEGYYPNLCDMIMKLDDNPSFNAFNEWIGEVHAIEGEAGKYDGDAKLKNGIELHEIAELWNVIVHIVDVSLPIFHCEIFNSWRQAPDCPYGEVSFIFDEDGCYIKELSEEGKNLDKMLGDLIVSTWTDISY